MRGFNQIMQNMHRVNWLYFLGTEDNKDEIFIYGLSLPTKYDNKMNSNPYKLGVIGDKNINRLILVYRIEIVSAGLNNEFIDFWSALLISKTL